MGSGPGSVDWARFGVVWLANGCGFLSGIEWYWSRLKVAKSGVVHEFSVGHRKSGQCRDAPTSNHLVR